MPLIISECYNNYMKLRFASDVEINEWNNQIISNPDGGNVLQSLEFSKVKQLGGWTPRYLMADKLAVTVLEKTAPLLGKLWYVPKGPGVVRSLDLPELVSALSDLARKNKVFLLKIEPELTKTDETKLDLLKLSLKPAGHIQPDATVVINIEPSLDTVMKSLNQKGRHAIRRGERDGVTVERVDSSDENCHKMFKLLSETAKDSFSIRSFDYYKKFWQLFEHSGAGQMFFAYADNKLVAAAYGLVFGKKATYKDGASVRARPVYGASHYLQWHVIQWAKENGATSHDLSGTPPSDLVKDTSHPYYGLGRFKTSFNKQVTDYVGVYDLPIRPLAYKIWLKFGSKAAKKIHFMRHHENYY